MNAEIKIEKMHNLKIIGDKLFIDGNAIPGFQFIKHEITFKCPDKSTVTFVFRDLKPDTEIVSEIDDIGFDQLQRLIRG